MFRSVDGKVDVVPSIYKTKGLVFDKALKPPFATTPKTANPPVNPNGYS
jgi:hypothetical protein